MIGKRCEARRRAAEPWEEAKKGLKEGKVLLMLGMQDVVISSEETAEDATEALGKENIEIVRLQGGHDLPIVSAEQCAKAMMDFWHGAMAS